MLTCNAFSLLPFTPHSSILPLCEPSRIVRSYTTEVRTHELQPRSAPTILWRATTTPAAIWPTTNPVHTTTAVPTTAIRPATTIWSAPVRLPTRTRLRTVTTERLAHHTALVHLFGSTRRSSLLCRKNRQRDSSTTHARRLWYLDACRLHHDPYRQLHGQQRSSISQKLMQSTSLTSLGKVGLYILLPLALIVVPTSWIESRRSICLNSYLARCTLPWVWHDQGYLLHLPRPLQASISIQQTDHYRLPAPLPLMATRRDN